MNGKTALFRSQLNILKPFVEKCSLSTVRRAQDKIGRMMANSYKTQVVTEKIRLENIRCAMLTPLDELTDGVILYLHGGGFVAGNLDYALGFGSVLAVKCGIKVFTVEYRLAPEHPYPAALDDAMEAYGYLLSSGFDPSRIALCGDSAGGGLCYALCQKLRDKGRSMPSGIIAVSPWTDLTQSGESYTVNKKADPSMTAERLKYFADSYVYGAEKDEKGRLFPVTNPDAEDDKAKKSDPRISPLFDTQEKMPESLIFVGNDEIMYDDSFLLHEKLLSAGCKSELVVAPELWHGYVLYDLPERAGDYDKIAKFIKKVIPTHKRLAWMTLDNAAKIFPASRSRTWSNMFRVSSTLNEEIDREALAVALDVTVRRFPSIAVCIKEGLFWYYLEEISAPPEILDEKPYPLARMRMKDLRKCAFRVLVYKNRLAVEFFHSLTDGNGGLIFVKTLTAEYLYQKYGTKVPVGNGVWDRLEEPSADEIEDSFIKYAGKYPASRKDTDAYIIEGKRETDGFRTVTSFVIDSDFVRAEAKKRGVTVTVYMSALLAEASQRVQRARVKNTAKYKPIKIFVPVNLRKMFPSKTMRNFILYTMLSIDFKVGDYGIDDMCQIFSAQMKQQMTEKNMSSIIRTNVNSEKNLFIRVVPLVLKNIIMKAVFYAVGEKKSCYSFSNLGVVNMPPEYTDRVKRMDFILGSQSTAPYNISSLSYEGKMYLNVTRNAKEPVLEAEIFHVLREMGVPHSIESNSRGKE